MEGYKFGEEEIRKTVERMDFEKLGGIIPAVTIDENGMVLMLAFMNREALVKTMQTGSMHYWSRSRQKLWMKGEESGHRQFVLGAYVDCDNDSVLFKVHQIGPACHTGGATCFSEALMEYKVGPELIGELEGVIKERMRLPKEGSHTSEVIGKGMKEAAKKVGEEAFEVSVAALSEDKGRTVDEAADLIYHLMILLQLKGADMKEVFIELARRRK